jgi:hypothetical protein
MRFLKKNTAISLTVGPFFDKTDGVTPEVALTVTSCKLTFMVDTGDVPTLVIDAAPTASAGSNDMVHVTGDDAGFYDLELTAAQTNYVGRAMLAITDAVTHCPVFHEFTILPANVYDSLMGTDNLQVDVTQWLGTACATPTVAGVPEVDLTHISGDAQSATDLKDFADAGYDPVTNQVQGVVTVSAVTDGVTLAADQAVNVTKINGIANAAARLAQSAATIVNGTAITGTLSTTQMTTDLTEATNDHYKGRVIIWTSGSLINQATDITAYNGTTKMLTYTATTEAPANGDTFIIV